MLNPVSYRALRIPAVEQESRATTTNWLRNCLPRAVALLVMALPPLAHGQQAHGQAAIAESVISDPNATAASAQTSFMNSNDPGKDAIGDPLPVRALMRLGTHRFQHPDSVNTVVVSPDESYILSLGYNHLIKWEAETGREIWRKPWDGQRISGPAYGQRWLCFAGSDSSIFFSPGQGRTVLKWNAATGENEAVKLQRGFQLADLFGGRDTGNKSIDVTKDASAFLVGGQSGLGLYAADGEQEWFVANRPKTPVQIGGNRDRLDFGGDYATGQFSPDGNVIAAAFSEARTAIRLMDPSSGKSTGEIQTRDKMVRMVFSDDGKSLFTTERDCGIRSYSIESQELIWEFELQPDPQGAESYASAIACSANGELIAAGAPIGPRYWIYLLEAKTGKQVSILKSNMWKPWAVQFTDNDRVLVSSGWDASIRRWDVATGSELPLPVGIRASDVVTMSPDGRHIAFRDGTDKVRVLDTQTGEQQISLPAGGASALLFTTTGDRIFVGVRLDEDLHLREFSLTSDRATQSWRWPRGEDPHSSIEELATDQLGRYLAAASFRQDKAYVWDTGTGQKIAECPHREIYGLAVSPDGARLVTVGWDKMIRVWEIKTGERLQAVQVEEAMGDPALKAGDSRMYGVRFAPDGKRIAACHMDGHVSVWEVTPHQLTPIFLFNTETRFSFGALDYSPDGLWIACGDGTGNVILFDAHNGERMLKVGKHEDSIYTLRFGRDSSRLVSGGGSVAYLWALDDPGEASQLAATDLWNQLRMFPGSNEPADERGPAPNVSYPAIVAISQSKEACAYVLDRLQQIEAVADPDALRAPQNSPLQAAVLRKAAEDDSFELRSTVHHALLALRLSRFATAKQGLDWIAESHRSESIRELARELR